MGSRLYPSAQLSGSRLKAQGSETILTEPAQGFQAHGSESILTEPAQGFRAHGSESILTER
jgi:hypothetical protein